MSLSGASASSPGSPAGDDVQAGVGAPDSGAPDAASSRRSSGSGSSRGTSGSGRDRAPGVGEAIGDTRDAFARLIQAHLGLLRAELAVAGRELGIIVGLAAAAVGLLILIALLLYIGGWLFFGDWLFGSMGWGIIHGTLLNAALIGLVAVNLGGGSVRAYLVGLIVGLIVTMGLAALLASNAGNDLAEWGAGGLAQQLSLDENWAPTLLGLVVGAVVAGVAALAVGWWKWLRGRPLLWAVLAAAVAGAFAGALIASTRYDNPNGVAGLAIMVGLLTWIIIGGLLAYWRGFDPEARYENLVPRRSMESFEGTRDFIQEQLKRQKDRMMGR